MTTERVDKRERRQALLRAARDVFASRGLKLAEWPEKAAPMLPVADLDIALQTDSETQRQATLTARTPTGLALLQAALGDGASR